VETNATAMSAPSAGPSKQLLNALFNLIVMVIAPGYSPLRS
jgi:hypothetical protein